MPSSYIVKPVADILCDYVDAVRSAADLQEMFTAADQAVLEFQCSYGLSRPEAILVMGKALVISMTKEVSGAPAPEPTTAANFI